MPIATSPDTRTSVRKTVAVRVHPPAERALRAGHPWLFEDGIRTVSHPPDVGDVAVVFDRKGRFLAAGLWDPDGPIRIRILAAREPESIGVDLFRSRVAAAAGHRHPLASDPSTTGIRWVFGESDGLPGIILDGYDGHLVLKLYSAGWGPHVDGLLEAIRDVLAPKSIFLLAARNVQQNPAVEALLRTPTWVNGAWADSEPGALPFLEHGGRFEAHPAVGHKTGFYLDQRDNRKRLREKPGGRVLNAFSYTGGFSVAAALGGASSVISVDISRAALAQADRHIDLNRAWTRAAGFDHQIRVGDAFQVLRDLAESGLRLDTVVVDPPAFAKERRQVDRALAQYARLTTLAVALIRPDGKLVQSSCSARVNPERFQEVIEQAAHRAGRPLHAVSQTGHPLDHPIRHPESAYLKTVWARVE
jgi:23S rRNA (cytosine1962-C5)-methyltransferase